MNEMMTGLVNDLIYSTKNTVASPPVHTPTTVIVKPDSGATGNYFRSKDAHILQNRVCASGPTVTLPNNETITACESGNLPVQGISEFASETHVYDELHSA